KSRKSNFRWTSVAADVVAVGACVSANVLHQRGSVSNALLCTSSARPDRVSCVALSLRKHGATSSRPGLHGSGNRGGECRLRNSATDNTTRNRLHPSVAQTTPGVRAVHQQKPLCVFDGDGVWTRSRNRSFGR